MAGTSGFMQQKTRPSRIVIVCVGTCAAPSAMLKCPFCEARTRLLKVPYAPGAMVCSHAFPNGGKGPLTQRHVMSLLGCDSGCKHTAPSDWQMPICGCGAGRACLPYDMNWFCHRRALARSVAAKKLSTQKITSATRLRNWMGVIARACRSSLHRLGGTDYREKVCRSGETTELQSQCSHLLTNNVHCSDLRS